MTTRSPFVRPLHRLRPRPDEPGRAPRAAGAAAWAAAPSGSRIPPLCRGPAGAWSLRRPAPRHHARPHGRHHTRTRVGRRARDRPPRPPPHAV